MSMIKSPRDSQRKAVYDWEDRLSGIYTTPYKTRMPLHDCKSLIEDLWAVYGVGAPPVLKDGRGRRRACGGRSYISLPVWSRLPIIVVHETTHALMELHYGYQYAWHGPMFVRAYMELLITVLGYTREQLTKELTTGKRQVKVAPEGSVAWLAG